MLPKITHKIVKPHKNKKCYQTYHEYYTDRKKNFLLVREPLLLMLNIKILPLLLISLECYFFQLAYILSL